MHFIASHSFNGMIKNFMLVCQMEARWWGYTDRAGGNIWLSCGPGGGISLIGRADSIWCKCGGDLLLEFLKHNCFCFLNSFLPFSKLNIILRTVEEILILSVFEFELWYFFSFVRHETLYYSLVVNGNSIINI